MTKSINFPTEKGEIVRISTDDTDYICKIVDNFRFSHLSDEKEILKYVVEEIRWASARAVYLQVQSR